jgi:flavin reductase (DIM6/NTAB) family NADH-FMN oxidoreductase RutF
MSSSINRIPATGEEFAVTGPSRCFATETTSPASDSDNRPPPLTVTMGSNPRRVLGQQVANVAVVTTCHHGTPVGVLVTSLASVSTQPPLVSFSVSSTSSGWPALEQAEHFGLHLLATGQEDLAERFAPGRPGNFGPSASTPWWQPGPYGTPILTGCAAWTVARPQQWVHTGAHVIIVARLLAGDARDDALPLLQQAGAYHRLAS